MLSKCANPDCNEQFDVLTQGNFSHLTPTPEMEVMDEDYLPVLYERSWLWDLCSKTMACGAGGVYDCPGITDARNAEGRAHL